jgi:hypothetical protein
MTVKSFIRYQEKLELIIKNVKKFSLLHALCDKTWRKENHRPTDRRNEKPNRRPPGDRFGASQGEAPRDDWDIYHFIAQRQEKSKAAGAGISSERDNFLNAGQRSVATHKSEKKEASTQG